jgi:predicted metal-binding membrane protein
MAASTATGDTPRSAYRVLELRATLLTVAVLLGFAAAAWWMTLGNAREMSSMVQGFASVGGAMPFDIGAVVFLGMWTTMTVAMMFPTVAPIVLLHRMVLRRRGEGPALTVAFVAGYLLIWTVSGAVPLAVLVGFRHLSQDSTWIVRAGGVVLVLAGAYQFTRWKETCARACRSPLTFLATHNFGSGPLGVLRTGLSHGLYCLGCCWALMAVLLVVGLMNLTWMAGIAVIFLAEKHWRRGAVLASAVGVVLVCLGLGVLAHPPLLAAVATAPAASAVE